MMIRNFARYNAPTPFATNMAFNPAESNAMFVAGAFDQWKEPFSASRPAVEPMSSLSVEVNRQKSVR
jgi:hypothetical protein